MGTIKEENNVELDFQNEIERGRQDKEREKDRDAQLAFVDLENALESQKKQVKQLITERLVENKFALVTAKDLGLTITPEMNPKYRAYQVVSNFYDEIAGEFGLIRVKVKPGFRNEKFYLTGDQRVAYKSDKPNAVYGLNKDYEDTLKNMNNAKVGQLIISSIVGVTMTVIVMGTIALCIWFSNVDISLNDPRLAIMGAIMVLSLTGCLYLLQRLFD